MKKLNLLSYNKRNIIQKTWRNDPDEDTDDEYFAKLTREDENIKDLEYVEVYDNDNNISYLKVVESEDDSSDSVRKPLIVTKSTKIKPIEIIV
jgi:hypothetical protein